MYLFIYNKSFIVTVRVLHFLRIQSFHYDVIEGADLIHGRKLITRNNFSFL